LHAQNHAAVAVAIALVEGKVFMREFFDCYKDPRVIELGEKTEVYTDQEIDRIFPAKIGTRLEIFTKDAHYHIFEDDKQPVSPSFIKEKFRALASPLLPRENMENIINAVNVLEKLENISRLSDLFP
jgi:2-methylcitrate dehydratase PrpD